MMMPTQKEILEVKSAPRAEFLLPGILSTPLTHLDGYHSTAILNVFTQFLIYCVLSSFPEEDKSNMTLNFQNLMTLNQTVLPLDQ